MSIKDDGKARVAIKTHVAKRYRGETDDVVGKCFGLCKQISTKEAQETKAAYRRRFAEEGDS